MSDVQNMVGFFRIMIEVVLFNKLNWFDFCLFGCLDALQLFSQLIISVEVMVLRKQVGQCDFAVLTLLNEVLYDGLSEATARANNQKTHFDKMYNLYEGQSHRTVRS